MLPDVGMVQMYSKLANVNDLGFACTGCPPLCMDRPSSLFLQFFRQVVCYALETHCTIPTSVLVFGGNIFTHPCFLTFYGMQIAHGQWLVYLKGFQTIVSTNECASNAWQGV